MSKKEYLYDQLLPPICNIILEYLEPIQLKIPVDKGSHRGIFHWLGTKRGLVSTEFWTNPSRHMIAGETQIDKIDEYPIVWDVISLDSTNPTSLDEILSRTSVVIERSNVDHVYRTVSLTRLHLFMLRENAYGWSMCYELIPDISKMRWVSFDFGSNIDPYISICPFAVSIIGE